MKFATGLVLAFAIGVVSRLSGLPLPAPPALIGALLVLAMTLGYMAADRWFATRAAANAEKCGGPSGTSGTEHDHA
jgi:XapX domain-containing protein